MEDQKFKVILISKSEASLAGLRSTLGRRRRGVGRFYSSVFVTF